MRVLGDLIVRTHLKERKEHIGSVIDDIWIWVFFNFCSPNATSVTDHQFNKGED